MSENATDVLIVGAGVIGLSCARALLAAGRSVRVIEAKDVGAGASHANCGTLTPSHAPPLAGPGTIQQALKWMLTPDAPLYVHPKMDPRLWRWLMRFALRCNYKDWRDSAIAKYALLSDSRQRIEDWVAKDALNCEFMPSGEDYLFRTEAGLQHEQWELPMLRELGVQVRIVGGREYEAQEPTLKPGLAGAICFDGDAMLRPDRYVDELARVVREAGGVIETGCALQGLDESNEGIEARTNLGVRRAREIIVAGGAWSPLLADALRLPWLRGVIQPGKGYSITYSPPSIVPKRPLMLRERSVCVTAFANGYRLGSTMEFSGYDESLNPRRLGALVRGATEYMHEPVGPEVRERWFGWRPMCVDDVPIIGKARDRLWLATGHGMMGVGMSAGTGQLMADLVTGTAPAVDPSAYSPQRFV